MQHSAITQRGVLAAGRAAGLLTMKFILCRTPLGSQWEQSAELLTNAWLAAAR